MADRTTINYVDASWNPVAGCTPVSAGCAHCFAARYAGRHLGAFADRRPFGAVRMRPEQLLLPLRWRQPRRILVPTLGDLFHPDVPTWYLDRVYAVMALAYHHRFLVLTKRPSRLRVWEARADRAQLVKAAAREVGYALEFHGLSLLPRAPDHIWFGVSVEDQATADERIPILLQTPAAHRWVSYEPALRPLDLSIYLASGYEDPPHDNILEWIVVGGETGARARICRTEWIRAVADHGRAAGVPVWVKQLGALSVGHAEGSVVRQRPAEREAPHGSC